MPVKINGATSGSLTIKAPDTGSDVEVDLIGSLAAKVNGSSGSTPPASPVTGQIFVDTDDNSIKVWSGSAWVDPSNAGGPVAIVSGTTGSPSVTSYTQNGVTFDVYLWTASGSCTIGTAGYADLWVVGGGMDGFAGYIGGGSGGVRGAYLYVATGTHTVTIGAKSSWNADGGTSSFGSLVSAGGGISITRNTGHGKGGGGGVLGTDNIGGGGAGETTTTSSGGAGVTSTIVNGSTSVEYGRGGNGGTQTTPAANTGFGGNGSVAASAGVVILRVAR